MNWISKFSKQEWSWAFFDWANSAFATTVMAGFFPIFYKTYYAAKLSSVESTAMLGIGLSISGVIAAALNPFLGFLSDTYQTRKLATLAAAVITGLSLIILFYSQENQWLLSLCAFGVGLVGFNLSLSFYDSLLSVVTNKPRHHQVSALGYSLGYLGGGLLFLLNVLMVQMPEIFGFENKIQAVKWSFLSVVIWWLIFSIPFYTQVHEPKSSSSSSSSRTKSFSVTLLLGDFHRSLKKILRDRNVALFLIAYWLFIDAVYTVINMATDYGTAIGLDSGDLIKALLLVQFLGFPFALLAGSATRYFSVKSTLIVLLSVYFIAIIWATQMKYAWEFWGLAILIAIAQGGVQSLSRSLFSNLIPSEQSGEYFGVFNLVGRFASIMGPLIIALLTQVTESHRLALLGLLLPLMGGMILLSHVKSQ